MEELGKVRLANSTDGPPSIVPKRGLEVQDGAILDQGLELLGGCVDEEVYQEVLDILSSFFEIGLGWTALSDD